MGQHVQQNFQKAAKYYRTAGNKKHSIALYSLAKLYAEGQGVEQDYQESINLCIVNILFKEHLLVKKFIFLSIF